MAGSSPISPCVLPVRAMQALGVGLALVVLALPALLAGPARADALFGSFTAISAQADALRSEAGGLAKQAQAHPFAAPRQFNMASGFAARVMAFSTAAAALSAAIDTRGGPKDLRCIYRGMAADAKKRLAALQDAQNAGAQAIIFKDMAALFADAVEVTPTSPAALADRHDGAAAQ